MTKYLFYVLSGIVIGLLVGVYSALKMFLTLDKSGWEPGLIGGGLIMLFLLPGYVGASATLGGWLGYKYYTSNH